MFSKKSRKSIRTRLISRVVIFLALSLVVVTTIIYFLLATSLRKSDQNLILNLGQTYQKLYEEGGSSLLKDRVSPEILLVIKDVNGSEPFVHWPAFIDSDFEDEEEIEQIKNEIETIPLRNGWSNVLLLSGDENRDILKKTEYQLRVLANKRNWETVLPIIDNDLFEIYAKKINNTQWMLIGKSSEVREEHLSQIRYISFMVIVPFLVMGLFLTFILAENILRPIKNLAYTIKNNQRAEVRGSNDEIDHLAEEFNLLHEKNQILVKNLKETVDNVAHDLRTPLTRFRTSAEMALMKENDLQKMKSALEDAVESSDDVLNLLNAIMDVAEAESSTLPLKIIETPIDSIITTVLDLYSHVAEDKKIILNYTSANHATIKADYQRMIQAIGNIVDNAIKYSAPDSQVRIHTELIDKQVRIFIEDEGPGIDVHEQSRIWSRLYRGDSSRSTTGLGIGLSLVKAVIEAHKGHIELVSTVGKGSIFIVSLPICNVPVINT